jgi:hypothetical protein
MCKCAYIYTLRQIPLPSCKYCPLRRNINLSSLLLVSLFSLLIPLPKRAMGDVPDSG